MKEGGRVQGKKKNKVSEKPREKAEQDVSNLLSQQALANGPIAAMTGWTWGNTTLHSSLLPRDSSASFSPTSGFGRRQRPTEGPRSCFSKRSWTSQHEVEMPHECACSTATVSETLRVVCLCHLCLTAFSPFSFPDTGKPGRFDTRSEIRTFLGSSYVL